MASMEPAFNPMSDSASEAAAVGSSNDGDDPVNGQAMESTDATIQNSPVVNPMSGSTDKAAAVALKATLIDMTGIPISRKHSST